jgi:hypothetical protein
MERAEGIGMDSWAKSVIGYFIAGRNISLIFKAEYCRRAAGCVNGIINNCDIPSLWQTKRHEFKLIPDDFYNLQRNMSQIKKENSTCS